MSSRDGKQNIAVCKAKHAADVTPPELKDSERHLFFRSPFVVFAVFIVCQVESTAPPSLCRWSESRPTHARLIRPDSEEEEEEQWRLQTRSLHQIQAQCV